MKRILISPSKYIQGEGEYDNLYEYVSIFGKKVFFVAHPDDRQRVTKQLHILQSHDGVEIIFADFSGESTLKEIEDFSKIASSEKCDVIIGLGGGKALDTAKGVAYYNEKPLIVMPTIASTDAPCSCSSVLYFEDGTFDHYFVYKKNPDIVLVDSSIIAKAPVRFLVSGIGDALSTYFEARACKRSDSANIPGGKMTKAAYAIARQCYETILEDAVNAKIACECKVVTPALENIIEANILLSGLGFESGGLAAAHSVHNGLTVLEEVHKFYHGEKVVFGVIVQLVLENAPAEEIAEVLAVCKALGLPTCLKDIGVVEVTEEKIRKVAEATCVSTETVHNMPFEVTPSDVYSAILVADKLGTSA